MPGEEADVSYDDDNEAPTRDDDHVPRQLERQCSLAPLPLCEAMYDEVRRFLGSRGLGLEKVESYRDVRYFYWTTHTHCYVAIIPLTYEPAPRIHARVNFGASFMEGAGYGDCVSDVAELTHFLERCFHPEQRALYDEELRHKAALQRRNAQACQHAKRLVAIWAKGIAERVLHDLVVPLIPTQAPTLSTLCLQTTTTQQQPNNNSEPVLITDDLLLQEEVDPKLLQAHLLTCLVQELQSFSSSE